MDDKGQHMGNGAVTGICRGLIGALLMMFALSGCQESSEAPKIPPPEVSVLSVTPNTVPVTFVMPGQTEASREVEIRAQIGGLIKKRYFTEGQEVQQGTPLYLIEPVPFKAALRRAEAGVAEARSRLVGAQRTVARLTPLLKHRATAQKDVDDAIAQEGQAKAALAAAEADILTARFDLKNTVIEAPLSGRIARSKIPEGGLVAAQTDLLTTILQVNPIYVTFSYADNELLRVEKEVSSGGVVFPAADQWDITLALSDGSVFAERGKLNFDARRVSLETGTIQARAEFPNPKNLLLPGRFVHVTLNGIQRPNAILIPQRAVLEGSQGPFVFVVSPETKAEVRVVQIGESIGEDRLITKGLGAGDQVIVDGVLKVRPGSPVTTTPAHRADTPPEAAPAASTR